MTVHAARKRERGAGERTRSLHLGREIRSRIYVGGTICRRRESRRVNETRRIQGRTLCEDGTSLRSRRTRMRILAYCPESRTMKNQSPTVARACRTFELSGARYAPTCAHVCMSRTNTKNARRTRAPEDEDAPSGSSTRA